MEKMEKIGIALNMIVKDESHVILETLANLCRYITFDYWVISDTGSTDNTQELIAGFFRDKGIPGELVQHEWRDFAYNRTMALEAVYDKTDYVLIFDADDSIVGDFRLPILDTTKYDAYYLKFGSGTEYKRKSLVNNRKRWNYVGVLHEIIHFIDPVKEEPTRLITGDYHVVSGRSGNRSKNPDKYRDDAAVLERAFATTEDKGMKARYAFYCAQSYYDAAMFDDAARWYKRVLELDNWNQEKYYACVRIGDIYKTQGDMVNAINYWSKSVNYDRERREGVTNIMEYYCNQDNHFLVNCLYERLKDRTITDTSDKLFWDANRHDDIHYYNSISACYVGEWMSGYYACRHLLMADKRVGITLQNFKCYSMNMHLDPKKNEILDKLVELFETIGKDKFGNSRYETDAVQSEKNDALGQELFGRVYDKISDLWTAKRNVLENANIGKKDPRCKGSNRVLIFTGFMNVQWNDTYVTNNSIGGSEKAVAYLARYLPKEYEIIISGDVADEVVGNITYINRGKLRELLEREQFHTIIVSRYISFFLLYPKFRCYQLFLSAHDAGGFLNNLDREPINDIILRNNKYIDGIICLTNWHKANIIEAHPYLADKMHIINNGILENFCNNNVKKSVGNAHDSILDNNCNRISNKFTWTSCSYRGLRTLLDLWPEILAAIPTATLHIASYDPFPKDDADKAMLAIINRHDDSITHHGRLNTEDLYRLQASAEYWLYTTNFCETSCITALEMLMAGVICLYYPIAGLVDTLGDYGVQVQQGQQGNPVQPGTPVQPGKPGNEIAAILSLTPERKAEMRVRGRAYARSCSWENRAIEWSIVLGLTTREKANKKPIAIYNSFPFHYEMFGYILHYAQINGHRVDVYTNFANNLDWIDFYSERFNTVSRFKNYTEYPDKTAEYAYEWVFVTTDDDREFKPEWITDRVISINHYYKIRAPNYRHYLNVANFCKPEKSDNGNGNDIVIAIDYCIPCYPLIDLAEKALLLLANPTRGYTVAIIGGGLGFDRGIVNRLHSASDIPINLAIFGRKANFTNIDKIDKRFKNIDFIEDIDTGAMIHQLKSCSHVLVNYTRNENQNNGQSSSGSIGLALSTLCIPIVARSSNQHFRLENAIEFSLDFDATLDLDLDQNPDINTIGKGLKEARDRQIAKFQILVEDFRAENANPVVQLRIFGDKSVTTCLEHWMSPERLKTLYDKPVVITTGENYTHAIIINTCMPTIRPTIPKENVIGLAHEPTLLLFCNQCYCDYCITNNTENKVRFIEYAKANIGKYFVGDSDDLPALFVEGPTFLNFNKTHFYDQPKTRFCSIVISKQSDILNSKLNYRYRHDLVRAILETDLPIDIYGYGVKDILEKREKREKDQRLKHELPWTLDNPFGLEPFADYKYHICIENVISNNYFSEKIVNPLLSNNTPIYYGCKKIDEYFGPIIKLTGVVADDIAILRDLYINHDLEKEKEKREKTDKTDKTDKTVKTARYASLLEQTNLFSNLHKLFDTIGLAKQSRLKVKVKVFIIHYKKLVDRKEYLIKQFAREKITNFEFVTIDRDDLTSDDLANFHPSYARSLTANFLSHVYAYRQISEDQDLDTFNLILEDDVVLCPNFSDILAAYLEQIPCDFDAVFIGDGCDIPAHHIPPSSLVENRNIYEYCGENKCKCADSYIISTKCARKLIESFALINEPIDHFLNRPLKACSVYWAEPTLVKQGTIIGLFRSSIGNGMLRCNTGFNPLILTCYKSPFTKIRLGKNFDGGYILCDIPGIDYDFFISCGVSDDISFEEEFCNKYPRTRCNAYDGTIDAIHFTNQNIKFFRQNINTFNDANNTDLHEVIDTVGTVCYKDNCNYNCNIFLKMDIEGHEIPWIKTLSDAQLGRFAQIVIEFHFPFNDAEIEVFEKLNRQFLIVHFHGNNSCGIRTHNGVVIPNIFECTYLNRRFFNNYYELNAETIPSDIDMQNVLYKPEILIDYKPFVHNIAPNITHIHKQPATIHTIGDSHCYSGWSNIITPHHLGPVLCYTFGKDRCDLRNPAYSIRDGDTVIFCFGEIDCRCHVYKHINETTTYEQVIDAIVENYVEAIKVTIATSQLKLKRVGVYNVVPPVQRHNTHEDPGYPYLGSDDERKAYVLYFNQLLRAKCAENNFVMFDVYDNYADNNGFLRKELSDGQVHIRDGIYIRDFMRNLSRDPLSCDPLMKKHFLSFGGPTQNYHDSLQRFLGEVKAINVFDHVYGLTDHDLKTDAHFWNRHCDFMENNARGYGYWLWKSYIVKKTLEKMADDDIMVYADCGCEINPSEKALSRLYEYFDMVNNSEHGILSFQMSHNHHRESRWTKMDILRHLDAQDLKETGQLIATVFILRKCQKTVRLVDKWYSTCCLYKLCDDSPSSIPNSADFSENRHDQSVFSVLRKKYGTVILADETFSQTFTEDWPILAKRIRGRSPFNPP